MRVHQSGADNWTPRNSSGLTWTDKNGPLQPMHTDQPRGGWLCVAVAVVVGCAPALLWWLT